MAELRLVVFDVDGTLIDSLNHIKSSMAQAFEACNLQAPTEASVRRIIGLSLPQVMANLHPQGSDNQRNDLVEAYKASFMAKREASSADETAPLFPGARASLEALAGDDTLLLGVATGKSRRGLDKMYQAHGIGQYFVTSQVADDHPSKPHPSMLEQTLRDTGVDANAAVIIGDTSFDMEMGRLAGFNTIGVRWGYHDDAALAPFADQMIDSYADLPGALGNVWESMP